MNPPFFCGLVVSLVFPCLGTEIEAKDGRKFEGTILSATDKAVSVRKAGKDVTIQRDSLSVETNKAIDDFLKEKRDTNDKDLSNFEMTIGGKLRRISLWLPDRRVPLTPSTSSTILISGGSTSSQVSLSFSSGETMETAETAMNNRKQSLIASANHLPKAVAEKIAKTINVEKKVYGEWSGYVLEGWSERESSEGAASSVLQNAYSAYFVKDGIGVSFHFWLKDGGFTRRNMDKVIESVKIEAVE
jgi:hypothetical protein